uniref:Elongator complex protein 1 n=1 Tax=Trichuris muris TaxID=70415 RepID=A0A5S6Q895_TRIMR
MRNLKLLRCTSAQIPGVPGIPAQFAYNGVTDTLIVASDDAIAAWNGHLLWETSVKEVCSLKDDRVIGFTYVPVDMVCYFVTKHGSVYSLQESREAPLKEVVSVGLTLAAAAWSPDSALLAIVSACGQLRLYEKNHWTHIQVSAFPEDSGIEKHVDIGWGRKETQFRGSLGKLTIRHGKSTENAEQHPISMAQESAGTMICWDSLGECIAVSVFSPTCGRRVHIWNSRLLHLRSLEHLPNIGLPISWRPNGGRIVCCQYSQAEAASLVLFEEKGLKHREFLLPKFFAGFEVCIIAWSSQSDILAIHLRSSENEAEFVLLYTFSNYHWYLKKTFRFLKPKTVSCLKWEAEQPRTLHIVFHDWSYLCLDFLWHTCRQRSTVAVVDGEAVLFTDFSSGIIPPPMCQTSLQMSFFVNEVTFGHNDDDIYALLCGNRVCRISGAKQAETHATATLKVDIDHISENAICYNLNYVDEHHLLLLLSDLFSLSLVIAEVDWVNTRLQIKRTHALPWSFARAWRFSTDSGALIYLQAGTGSVLKFALPELLSADALPVNRLSKCGSSSCCGQLDVLKYSDEVHLVSLDEFNKLYVDEHLLSSVVTSFAVHCDKYLLFTTINHKLCVIPTKRVSQKNVKYDDELLNVDDELLGDFRPVERGSRIVCSFGTSVVFQLPRGNLETIQPLPLLLSCLCDMLDRCDFREALVLTRRHTLDMNLIYDYNPDGFTKNIRRFIVEGGSEHLNLFVSQLRPANVVSTLYKFYFGTPDHRTLPGIHRCSSSSKSIETIFRLMLDEIQVLPERDNFLFVTLLLHIKLEETEKALLLLKERCNESGRSLFSDGIRHMLYFIDAEYLFNTALGTYDFDLVHMVAQNVQKDPKEYLPILNELIPLKLDYRKYKVDCILKRPLSALRNLALCGAEHFEELLSHVQLHNLYAQAIILCQGQPEELATIRSKFAEFLEAKKQFSDSAFQYEQCGRFDDALRCYKQSLNWRPAWGLMTTKMKMTEDQIKKIADFFVERLCAATRYPEACDVLRQVGGRDNRLAEILIESYSWMDALHEVNSLVDAEALKRKFRNKVISTAERIATGTKKLIEDLTTYSNRLKMVRQEKLDRPATLSNLHENYNDGLSVVTSIASSRTTTTKSKVSVVSSSSRAPIRKKVSLKQGSTFEDVALLNKLTELVLNVEQQQKEVAELLRVLVHMDLFEEAKRLQNSFTLLKDAVSSKISMIWPDVLHVNQLPIVSYQRERSSTEDNSTMSNAVWLADSLVVPKRRGDFAWKLRDFYVDVE